MRTRRHRSIRSWLTLTAVSAVAGSGLALISAASAAADEDHITVIPNSGTAIGEVTEGNGSGLALVGKFTDTGNPAGANTNCSPTLYSASIDWGDNQTSAGTVSMAENGTFSVSGSHTYASHGSFTVKTTIADTGGSTASATAAASVAQTAALAQTGGAWPISSEAGPYVLGAGLLLILVVLGWWGVLRDRIVWSSRGLR